MIIKGLFTSTIYRGDLDFQGHFDPWIFQFFNFQDFPVNFKLGFFNVSILQFSRFFGYLGFFFPQYFSFKNFEF